MEEESEPVTEVAEATEPSTPATEQPTEPESHTETESHAESHTESAVSETRASINLGSPTSSKHSGEDEAVINLDGGPDEFAEQNAAFDAPETKTEGQTVAAAPAPAEGEIGEADEKPAVIIKPSNDNTDQIQPTVIAEEVTLDNVRKSIADPEQIRHAENIFGQPRQPLGPAVYISPSESTVEEEEEPDSDILSYLAELGLQPEKKEPINREQYEEDYRILKENALRIRRKNGLLNKKISEYFRKRKMNRVFEETSIDVYESLLDKYEEKIDDYTELRAKTAREKEAVDNEMNDMKNLRDEQLAELGSSFSAMQMREKDIGHGLIDSNTGKAISNKVVERLLYRQEAKSEEIADIRLAYIKRRDKVKEIDNKIKALETIGGTLHLMDFEQLRMENQTFSDKIEERDEELMRLRDRYSHAMQALAHIREKNNIIEVQIEDLHEKKLVEEGQVSKFREELNLLKIQRDTNRAQRDKLKASTGILTYSKLLLDMEIGVKHIEELRDTLKELKAMNQENRIKLINIRNTIEKIEHLQAKRNQRRLKSRVTMKGAPRYYMNRPTLTYPVLPKIALLRSRLNKMKLDYNK